MVTSRDQEPDYSRQDYWDEKYINKNTEWDIGTIALPLKEYLDDITDTELKILIPGAGRGYEAEYLHKLGFKNVYVLDWSGVVLKEFVSRVEDFPKEHLIQDDFFIHEGEYDLIIEHVFFCSFHPKLREQYVKKIHALLTDNGTLAGLLFDDELNSNRPPFGGNKEEYRKLFEPYFDFGIFETAHNSIKPRMDREIFMIMSKKVKNYKL